MVTETYLPEINGVAVTMGHIVSELQARNHQIQLVRPRQHRDERPARRPNFEEMLQRGVPIPRYEALKMGLPAKQALVRSWSLERPDVVHIVTEGPLGWSALKAAQKLRIPVSSDFHTNFHTYTRHYGVGWLNKPIAAYLRKFHNLALCTMVPTDELRRELEAIGFEKLYVVARGVDTRLFDPARRDARLRSAWNAGDDDLVALSVGRLAPEKNLPLVLRAFEAMQAVNPRVRLVIVGDGPERARLEARHPRHVYAGVRTGADLAAHYASADVFLFPSVTETYGNVTIEAMASGLAVVAYGYAAAAEHIRHDHNGLAARFADDDAFVREAALLAGDRGRIARIRAAARATAAHLDWTSIVAAFEATLQEVIAAASRHGIEAAVSA